MFLLNVAKLRVLFQLFQNLAETVSKQPSQRFSIENIGQYGVREFAACLPRHASNAAAHFAHLARLYWNDFTVRPASNAGQRLGVFWDTKLGKIDPRRGHKHIGVEATGRAKTLVIDLTAIIRRDDFMQHDARNPASRSALRSAVNRDLPDRNLSPVCCRQQRPRRRLHAPARLVHQPR